MAITEKWAQEEMTAKGKPLQKMFDQVPEKYDFLNRIMTLGLDQIWRKKAAAYIIREQPRKVLDVGTGTGDMALFLAGQLPQAEVIGYDFSAPMLRKAEKKAEKKAEDTQLTNIKFIEGDVADIPLEDKSVDMISVSFAFRNMTYKNKYTHLYLNEVFRILKPGGKLVIVESSQPHSSLVRFFFHFYMKFIVAGLASRLSRHKGAYHYLAYSAIKFYNRKALSALLQEYGFGTVEHHPVFLGIVATTIAKKPLDYD